MKHLMVDIETMGTNVDCPIIQIGAVYFELSTGKIGKEFLINIDLKDSMEHGAVPDGSTIYFWLTQSQEARDSLLDPKTPFLTEIDGLVQFNEFWQGATEVWSHATFDFVILQHAMQRRNIRPWINFREAKDIRTLTFLAGMTKEEVAATKIVRKGTQHNALSDALFQVAYCSECYKKIKGL